jgi:hypothetical protein
MIKIQLCRDIHARSEVTNRAGLLDRKSITQALQSTLLVNASILLSGRLKRREQFFWMPGLFGDEIRVALWQLEEFMWWPFGRKKPVEPQRMPVNQISYSQVDITECFGDNLSLQADEWITTSALNVAVGNPTSVGLPPVDAGDDEVYEAANRLSLIRESLPLPSDGVYCPVCHIANIDLAKLRTACPKCGRELLQFGWE